MAITSRIRSKTPRFFRIVRNVGAVLGAVSLAIVSTPVSLPVGLVTLAGYLAVGSGVATAVAQCAKENE